MGLATGFGLGGVTGLGGAVGAGAGWAAGSAGFGAGAIISSDTSMACCGTRAGSSRFISRQPSHRPRCAAETSSKIAAPGR
ncbi:hypothetical protein [Methylococcus capsulatus]|uniref:hypothetical protein n=1 Tax=Methylococcus capsulatus TaxID=414 RepID=UPI00211ACA0E|nr:hypothetical protein [Methylococcus capsulatus]